MHILMVTIGYPPTYVGGTEVYVFGLVEELRQRGHECVITYIEPFVQLDGPGLRLERTSHLGTEVYVLQVNTAIHKLEFVMFDPELRKKLIAKLRKLVDEVNPDVVHLHPLQLGVESYLAEELNRTGRKVVMTFHSSTTTCARGDLIYMGKSVCDGRIIQERCTKCLYHWKSVPAPLAAALSQLPLNYYQGAYDKLDLKPRLRKLRSFASVPLLIAERSKAWARTTSNSKAVVAVCNWVREITLKNGVPPEKVFFSRHGLRLQSKGNRHQRTGPPTFGYLGRISPEKGIAPLLKALNSIPSTMEYAFEFCSSSFASSNRRAEEERLVREILQLQEADSRIRVLNDIDDEKLRTVLASWDALIVPSLWLEPGPQVVYEAYAVNTPVIGSRLGGIAELVRDGETGFLIPPGNSEELTNLLMDCIKQPSRVRSLRMNIGKVRSTRDVAEDMIKLYESIMVQAPIHDLPACAVI